MRLRSSLSADNVVSRLRAAVDSQNGVVTATFTNRYVVLRIAEARQHFGSPQLSFDVEADDSGSLLHGLFMPMPSIWTAFMALYGMIVFGGFCGAVYGYAQMQIGDAPYAFWALPATVVLLALVYLAACIGQRMGGAQMQELQQFVERALSEEERPGQRAES